MTLATGTRGNQSARVAIWVGALIFIGALLVVAERLINGRTTVQRVVVVYPEQWNRGDYHNCAIGPEDVVHHLPTLDCDQQAHDTPRSRMFVVDVPFDGKDNKLKVNQSWTCQRIGESLACKN